MTAEGGAGDAAGTARALARRLATLDRGPIRARSAARALAALDPDRAAHVLAALARSTGPEERSAWAAVALAFSGEAPELSYGWRSALYAAAREADTAEVAGLLVAPPAHRPYDEPRDKADPRLARLTLGHKKALARANRDPDLLARLAAEGEPAVVRELLRNPQVTEELVVRIAARRPCRPGTLRCLFESRRFGGRPAVALAIVRNPYAGTELALKLLPAVAAVELADVGRDGSVHPLVRAAAERLARERLGSVGSG